MSTTGSPQSLFPSIGQSKGSPDRTSAYREGQPTAQSQTLSIDGGSIVSGMSPNKDGRATETSLPKLVNDGAEGTSADEGRRKLTMVQQITKVSPSRLSNEDNPREFYPDPLPYQPQYFKSSTVLKMVSVPPRHQAMFGGKHLSNRKKGIIVHSERYQWNQKPSAEILQQQQSMLAPLGFTENKTVSRLSQRDRLLAERAYMEKMRGIKRKREILSHREPKDLMMESAKAEFTERFDVASELQRLKRIVLPVNARELYHGKGIVLPASHSSVKPRPRPPPYPVPSVASSAPAMLQSTSPIKHPKVPSRSYTQPNLRQPVVKKRPPPPPKVKTIPDIKRPTLPKLKTEEPVKRAAPPSIIESPPKLPSIDSESIASNRRSAPLFAKPRTTPLLTESEDEPEDANPAWTITNRAESEMEIDMPTEPNMQSLSVANSKAASPMKAVTPNPLKMLDVSGVVSDEEKKLLTEAFQRLDTDKDGHLTYVQAKNIVPKDVAVPEERFIKQVYDITSSSTFFGLCEFITLSCLCHEMSKLGEVVKEAYSKLNFQGLNESIIQYVELFESLDRTQKGFISMNSLEELLCTSLGKDRTDDISVLQEISRTVNPEMDESINKVKYLAHIPYFLTFEST